MLHGDALLSPGDAAGCAARDRPLSHLQPPRQSKRQLRVAHRVGWLGHRQDMDCVIICPRSSELLLTGAGVVSGDHTELAGAAVVPSGSEAS